MTRVWTEPDDALSVDRERKRGTAVWWLCYGGALFAVLVVAAYAHRYTLPGSIAFYILVASVVAAAFRPILGVYAIVFFSLIGDAEASPWFPFVKNLSSRESVLFISNSLTITPQQILIGATLVFWIVGMVGSRRFHIVWDLGATLLSIFTFFVMLGFVRGLSAGGDLRVAVFEGSAMFVILPVYVLVRNLCDRRQMRILMWLAFIAIEINALLAVRFLRTLPPAVTADLESLGEHPASLQWNFVILALLTLLLYRGGTRLTRLTLIVFCVPLVTATMASQRRGAFVALLVGVLLTLASLWWRNRRRLVKIAPIFLIVGAGYTAAFWGTTSGIGFPAQAIKTVIAPDQVSEADQSSDLYRERENFDTNFTVRASPLFGIGFGQKFYRPLALADISGFEFFEYIPHNSIIFVWLKTGFGGFFTMMLVIATFLRSGVKSLARERDPTMASFVMLGMSYLVMFSVFAFVDIAWEPKTTTMLALALTWCVVPPAARPPDDDLDADRDVQQIELTPMHA